MFTGQDRLQPWQALLSLPCGSEVARRCNPPSKGCLAEEERPPERDERVLRSAAHYPALMVLHAGTTITFRTGGGSRRRRLATAPVLSSATRRPVPRRTLTFGCDPHAS